MAYRVDEESLTAVADAIREKSGTSEGLTFPEGFVQAVAGIQAGGDTENALDVFIEEGIAEIVSDAREIRKYAFVNNEILKKVVFNKATKINAYAFRSCKSLESVYFPEVVTVENNAFEEPTVFSNGVKVKEINKENFPKLQEIGSKSFARAHVEKVHLPLVELVYSYAFSKCENLTECIFDSATEILNYAFETCKKLSKLVLKNDSVVSLKYENAFSGTPFASNGTGGTVYVPEALIESYKTASNWSTLYNAGTCNFVAIEGSEYDTTA